MTTLARDTTRAYSAEVDPLPEELPVIASDIIYEGAAVGANTSGHMRPLVSGDPFRGFCTKQADNSTGSATDINAKLRRQGIVQLTVTGASAATDVGLPVYATDDDTFTLTPTGSRIGTVTKWITSTTCLVFFQTDALQPRRRPRQVTKTADYTVVDADDRTVFNNLGAVGSVTFTLPAASTARLGMSVTFRACVAAQNMVITGTAGELITFNDIGANSVTFSTGSEIAGAEVKATCISTSKWFLSLRTEETQTATVAT
jgi:hypothetical protein